MFWGSFMCWLVAKLNEQASSTGHPFQTRGTFFLQRMFWHCTINSRSLNVKSYQKKSSVTYCFNILKKWSESCQNDLILQILTSVSKIPASIHLETTSGKSKWRVMDNHGPILDPIPCQPPFRQSPPGAIASPQSSLRRGFDWLHEWTNQLMVLQVVQINSFCWPKNWNSFGRLHLKISRKLKGSNADKVLIILDVPRKDGSNHCPYPVCQQICRPPFVDSESYQPLKHLALKFDALHQNLTGIKKNTLNLFIKTKNVQNIETSGIAVVYPTPFNN